MKELTYEFELDVCLPPQFHLLALKILPRNALEHLTETRFLSENVFSIEVSPLHHSKNFQGPSVGFDINAVPLFVCICWRNFMMVGDGGGRVKRGSAVGSGSESTLTAAPQPHPAGDGLANLYYLYLYM